MSTLFTGFSRNENIGVMASDTSLLKDSKTLFSGQKKIWQVGKKNLLGLVGRVPMMEVIVDEVKNIDEPEQILKKIFDILNHQTGQNRLRGQLLTVTDEGNFVFYVFEGREYQNESSAAAAYLDCDDSKNIPYGFFKIEENINNPIDLQFVSIPSYNEVLSSLTLNRDTKIIDLVPAVIQKVAEVRPNWHNNELVMWVINREGNITKLQGNPGLKEELEVCSSQSVPGKLFLRDANGDGEVRNLTLSQLNSKAITDIFESDGVTVKKATKTTRPVGLAFCMQSPTADQKTPKYVLKSNKTLLSIDVQTDPAPLAATTIRLYKNAGVQLAEFTVFTASTTYDMVDTDLNSEDVLYAAIIGSANGINTITIEVKLVDR